MMYDKARIDQLVDFISSRDGLMDKGQLQKEVQAHFSLQKKGSVFYCEAFAIRFSLAASQNFGNTVLALSKLRCFDDRPVISCVVTPSASYLRLMNTTFLKKISHSSQNLRCDNIRGSINGSDIMSEFEGIENSPAHFEALFALHKGHCFEENLVRLVEATHNITPTGKRFDHTEAERAWIEASVTRTVDFMRSEAYRQLEEDLNGRVQAVAEEIVLAASIDNVNIRGRVIEYLITEPDTPSKAELIECLHSGQALPEIYTADDLGDYQRDFDHYRTKIDIKSKLLGGHSSNPKGYNLDKLLAFLAEEDSVYLLFVVAVDVQNGIQTRLCSPFNSQLLKGTRIFEHCAGRNSRGVTQYEGKALQAILDDFDAAIDVAEAHAFIANCVGR